MESIERTLGRLDLSARQALLQPRHYNIGWMAILEGTEAIHGVPGPYARPKDTALAHEFRLAG
jgi:hypothetical protein